MLGDIAFVVHDQVISHFAFELRIKAKEKEIDNSFEKKKKTKLKFAVSTCLAAVGSGLWAPMNTLSINYRNSTIAIR